MMRHREPRRRPGSTLPSLGMGGADQRERAEHEQAGRHEDAGGQGYADSGAAQGHPGDGTPFSDPAFVSDIVLKRIFAHLIDSAILLAVMLPIGFFMLVTAIATFGLLILPFAFAFLAMRFLYYVGFTAGARSATPGMRMLGIELRTAGGGRPDFLQAFLRLTVYYVLIGLLTPLILLVALFNSQRRALHDMVSETIVVNRPAAPAV
jgi:uncharacterized RDD family membrane protein YckC